ncbi:MAG TPA: Ku protein [Terriglobia bacterium]|nr:Ku protein [Terriglobia bacterium]
MRAIWKGNISFALVSIPISLFSATRKSELSFHYLHKKDMSPVSYKRFCDTENSEVPWEEITRGYEYEKDQYVEITDEDLDKADIELTKTIQIQEFVQENEIDPVYFDKPYYLEPQKGGERAYALMRDALAQSKRVGIAKVVLKSREHLAAVKSVGNMLTLQTMRFSHEIVDAGSLNLPAKAEISKKEMDLANTLIDSMSDKFDPSRYKDDYYDKVLGIIQMKVAGVTPQVPAPKGPGPAKVVDLMEILKQSLNETKKAKAGRTPAVEEETLVAGDSRPTKPPRTRRAR